MAQAPDPGGGGRSGGAGAPRINRTIKEFTGRIPASFATRFPRAYSHGLKIFNRSARATSIRYRPRASRNPHSPVTPAPARLHGATVRGQQHLVNELRFVNPDDHGGNTQRNPRHGVT